MTPNAVLQSSTRNVVVRHHTHLARVDAVGEHAALFKLFGKLCDADSCVTDVEDDYVCLRFLRINLHAGNLCDSASEQLRVGVIFFQSCGHLL